MGSEGVGAEGGVGGSGKLRGADQNVYFCRSGKVGHWDQNGGSKVGRTVGRVKWVDGIQKLTGKWVG